MSAFAGESIIARTSPSAAFDAKNGEASKKVELQGGQADDSDWADWYVSGSRFGVRLRSLGSEKRSRAT